MAGAALWQAEVQIAWQAQHYVALGLRCHGRRSTLATSGIDFAAGAALSHCQVKISWQAQRLRDAGTDLLQIPLARARALARADFVVNRWTDRQRKID